MDYFVYCWSIFLIVLFFGGSIFVHELGHFLAAKKRGLKIEKFSIGFGPKLFSWEKDGIEYRISLLPLGGYVALPQLADMGRLEGKSDEDEEERKHLPPISFSDKVIVAVMGAVFNVLFAFAISVLLWLTGQPSTEMAESTTIGGIEENFYVNEELVPSPAKLAGLQPGDKILEIDGRKVNNFTDIMQGVALGWDRTSDGKPRSLLKIERNGETKDVEVLPQSVEINQVSGDKLLFIGISPYTPLLVDQIYPGSPAEKAGVKKGDVALSADGKKLFSVSGFSKICSEALGKGNDEVTLEILRDGKPMTLAIHPIMAITQKPMISISFDRNRNEGIVFAPVYAEKEMTPALLSNNDAAAKFEALAIMDKSGTFENVELGDLLISINGKAIDSINGFMEEVESAKVPMELLFRRGQHIFSVTIRDTFIPELVPAAKRPIVGMVFAPEGAKVMIHLDPVEQFSRQISRTVQTLQSLVHPKSQIGISSLSGPIGITRVLDHFATEGLDKHFSVGQLWDNFLKVLVFVVLLNINLAILNLLPVPVLDGGHILFAVIQKLRGKPLPMRVIATIQTTFMLLLFFGLFVYVGIFDINRWRGDKQTERSFSAQERVIISPPVFINSENKE